MKKLNRNKIYTIGKEKEALANQIQIDITDAIRTNPEVKKALNEQIENF